MALTDEVCDPADESAQIYKCVLIPSHYNMLYDSSKVYSDCIMHFQRIFILSMVHTTFQFTITRFKCINVCIMYWERVMLFVRYRSDAKAQKFRHEFHRPIAIGTCWRMCGILSKKVWAVHISRRLRVSTTCSFSFAILILDIEVNGFPSALQCVVKQRRSDSINDVKAFFWLTVSSVSNTPAKM